MNTLNGGVVLGWVDSNDQITFDVGEAKVFPGDEAELDCIIDPLYKACPAEYIRSIATLGVCAYRLREKIKTDDYNPLAQIDAERVGMPA